MTERYTTIVETSKVWSDLSRNMKGNIHKWMQRGIFMPERYSKPPTREPSLLSSADNVAIAVLFRLFGHGATYRWMQIQASNRRIQDILEFQQFRALFVMKPSKLVVYSSVDPDIVASEIKTTASLVFIWSLPIYEDFILRRDKL